MTIQRSTLACLVFLAAAALSWLAGNAAEPDPEPGPTWPKTTPAHRRQSANNLKQLTLAFHNANDTYGSMPASAIQTKAGKRLLSWRVAILPFIEQDKLYKEFKLDEPWDSKHNKKLLEKMPKVFAPTVTGKPAVANATYYQVFTGPDTPFNPRAVTVAGGGKAGLTFGPKIPATFQDGTSNTILIVEAEKPVPWTKPDDLVYDAKKAVPKLGGLFREGSHAGMGDGSVKFIGRKIDEKTLRALITPAGGEVIDEKKIPAAKPEK